MEKRGAGTEGLAQGWCLDELPGLPGQFCVPSSQVPAKCRAGPSLLAEALTPVGPLTELIAACCSPSLMFSQTLSDLSDSLNLVQ